MTDVTVSPLSIDDALELAPLMAACVQERYRGAPRRPDQFYAERLLEDGVAEIVGARIGDTLVGYAVFFDMPDMMTGKRTGLLNDMFVIQDAREQGAEDALIAAIQDRAAERRWSAVLWLVPDKPPVARALAEKFATPAGWSGFSIPVRA